jgi:hypothetical protein
MPHWLLRQFIRCTLRPLGYIIAYAHKRTYGKHMCMQLCYYLYVAKQRIVGLCLRLHQNASHFDVAEAKAQRVIRHYLHVALQRVLHFWVGGKVLRTHPLPRRVNIYTVRGTVYM